MENFTPYASLAGGILIGLSASLLMFLNGRIAGVSGIVAGLFTNPSMLEKVWRLAFIAGLILGGLAYASFNPIEIMPRENASTVILVVGGLLVGFGTAMGGGCTSGHGVCGMSRFSLRSILATLTFLVSGIVTVYIVQHVLGAAA